VRIFYVQRHPHQHTLFMHNSRAAIEFDFFTIVFVFHMFTDAGQSKNSRQQFIIMKRLTTEDRENAVNMLFKFVIKS
jgi:hypothetical protein